MEEQKNICTEGGFVWVDDKEFIPSHEECIETSVQPSMFVRGYCRGTEYATAVQPVVNTTMKTAAATAGMVAGLTTNLAWGIISNAPAASKAFYKALNRHSNVSFEEGD